MRSIWSQLHSPPHAATVGSVQQSFVSARLGYALIATAHGGLDLDETTDGGARWHHVTSFSAPQAWGAAPTSVR